MGSDGLTEAGARSILTIPRRSQADHRLDAWLSPFRESNGIRLVSEPRAFADPESEYEEDIGSKTAESAGAGAYRLWRHLSQRDGGVALEVGAGSGAITLGFVESADGFVSLVTDPSPAFLEIT